MPKGATKRALKTIATTDTALRQQRKGGYRYTEGVLNTLFGNLATTQKGLGRSLTRQNARVFSAISQLAAGAAREGKAVKGAGRRMSNLYGGATGPTITDSLSVAAASARGDRGVSQAQERLGQAGVRSANQALTIETQAAHEAKAGAQYQTALALQERENQDLAQVAQMRFDLEKMQLAFQQEKAMARFQKRLEDSANGGKLSGVYDELGQSQNYDQAQAIVGSAVQRYNLSPGQEAQLDAYLKTLYPNGAQSSNTLLGKQTKLDEADLEYIRTTVRDALGQIGENPTPQDIHKAFNAAHAVVLQTIQKNGGGPELEDASQKHLRQSFLNILQQLYPDQYEQYVALFGPWTSGPNQGLGHFLDFVTGKKEAPSAKPESLTQFFESTTR